MNVYKDSHHHSGNCCRDNVDANECKYQYQAESGNFIEWKSHGDGEFMCRKCPAAYLPGESIVPCAKNPPLSRFTADDDDLRQ
ncbi:hypothetical protein K0M31_010532 [Melipona bicolor]|uniref:Uncharacterized protein n=1 Tax=Melipona bicolor TaxID=60889 RepID=A0AA40FL89_9HYME|nr:hypothetical protein K0M31_010532 [Melipona bicolor]